MHGSGTVSSSNGGAPTSGTNQGQVTFDATPEGQQALTKAIEESPKKSSPSVDPLRTRLYRARLQALHIEEALHSGDTSTNFAQALGELGAPDGGFTIDPHTGKAEAAGFFVSVHPEHEVAIPVADVSLSKLNRYVVDKHDILSESGNFFGGWHDPDTGIVSLDVSSKTESAEEARELAANHDQVAFFDAQTFDSVDVDVSQRERIANTLERSDSDD